MLKLKRFDQGVWHEYQPGVKFKIKPMGKYDMVEIRLRSKRKIAVQGLSGPDNVADDYDGAAFMLETFRTCLLEWSGIEIEGIGNPSRDDIMRGLFEITEVRDFILTRSSEAFASEEGKLQDELKNSESSQAG